MTFGKRFFISLILCTEIVFAAHCYKEADYQRVWCQKHNGILEYKNFDFTRVDCLTSCHAVEFDFAKKWAESVGQALYYHIVTGKRAKVVLILENPETEMKYYFRVKRLSEIYDFDVEYITPAIFNH